MYGLHEDLIVENEIVRVTVQRQRLQNAAAEGAIAGVILGELPPAQEVLEQRQRAVGDVFVERHAAASAPLPRMREPSTTS